jgi:hypothetical protein
MTTLALDTVYKPIQSGKGSMIAKVAAVDVYESNAETEPASHATMALTDTIAINGKFSLPAPSRWILFKSAGAAVVEENGLVELF